MRRTTALMALASLALVAGVAFYVLRAPAEAPGRDSTTGVAVEGGLPNAPASAAIAEPNGGQGTPELPVPIPTSPATAQGLEGGDFEVHGWISTADQTPIPGAAVELFEDAGSPQTHSSPPAPDSQESAADGGAKSEGVPPEASGTRPGEGSARRLGSATSDAEGRFRIAVHLAPGPRSCVLVARAPGGGRGARSFAPQAGQPPRTVHLVIQDFLDSLTIQSVTADGKPVRGVRITGHGSGESDESDAGGFATVPVASNRLTHELFVAPPGSETFGVRIHSPELPNRANPAARIRVDTTTTVAGRVVDSRGSPVAQATVFAVAPQRFALSDAQGHFRLPLASEPDAALVLQCTHPRFRRHEITVSLAAIHGLVELRLEAGFDIGGRILAPDGASAVGVEVAVSHGGTTFSTLTDARGNFGFTGLDAGRWTVVARAPAAGLARTTTTVVLTPNLGLLLRLESCRSVRGRVVDEQGNGVGGAWVEAQNSTREMLDGAYCNAEGAFEFASPTGLAFLAAKKQGFIEVWDRYLPDRDAVLVLGTGTPLHGIALDAVTNEPIREFVMTITPTSNARAVPNRGAGLVTARITADEAGRFTTAPGVVPRGVSYVVRAQTQTHASRKVPLTVPAAGVVDELRLVFQSPRRIRVRLIDALSGSPIPGALVHTRPLQLEDSPFDGPRPERILESDVEGFVELVAKQVDAASARLNAQHPQYMEGWIDVDLQEEKDLDLLLRLRPVAGLAFVCTWPDRMHPPKDPAVEIKPLDADVPAFPNPAFLDDDGQGSATPIAAGRWRIIPKTGIAAIDADVKVVTVAAGERLIVHLGPPAPGEIEGTVTIDDLVPGTTGVELALRDPAADPTSAPLVTTTANAEGRFRLDRIPLGRYRLDASYRRDGRDFHGSLELAIDPGVNAVTLRLRTR